MLALVEAAILLLSAYIGISLRQAAVSGAEAFASFHFPQPLLFGVVVLVIMFSLGLYNAQFASRMQDILIRLLVCLFVSFIIFSVTFYVIPLLEIWRSALGISMALAFAGIFLVRYVFLHIIDISLLRRRILVIGVGDHAAEIESLQWVSRIQAYDCVGYVEVQGEEPKVPADKIFSAPNSLYDLVERNNVDEIVVAPQDRRGRIPMSSLLECRVNGVAVSDFVRFCERETGRINLDALHPSWFVYSDTIPGSRLQQSIKRLFDVVASVVFLILCMPIFIATAIAIRFDSPGPIFYLQERMGHRGETFRIIKFRSMRIDAENDGVPKWADKNDSRVTPVGAIIRKFRIDEMPQVINVLKGEMSFVGPRPERPYFVTQLAQSIPFYGNRHIVKPGITGWAQLNYSYGASSEDARRKLEYELYYIKHYSLLLDIMIILQTLRVVFWSHGVR
ncbi:MAG: TIGR03013 family XrtA/PEP-CTERM system glycosyltransferase [Pseudomonadota bacterium]